MGNPDYDRGYDDGWVDGLNEAGAVVLAAKALLRYPNSAAAVAVLVEALAAWDASPNAGIGDEE